MQALTAYWSDPRFLPHGFCLQWRPDVLLLHLLSDGVIALSYFSIPLAILWFLRRRRDLIAEHRHVALLFSIFILGCGLTHVFGMIVLWNPVYVLDGWVKALTALASVFTAVVLWPLVPRLLKIPSPNELEAVNTALAAEIAARREALAELQGIRANLEAEVHRRTAEVQSLARRFEIATSGSFISLVEQDAELRFTWEHNQRFISGSLIGKTDEEVLGEAAAKVLAPLKRQVLESGEPLRAEVSLPLGDDERHLEVRITPAEVGGSGRGLLIVSVDISEQKRQQEHLQLILRELAHRAKNLLSLVEGIARQTVKAEGLPKSFIERFGKRLSALGAAYDLLIGHDWRGVDLAALIDSQLAHVLPEGRARVAITGPAVVVGPEAGQYLALAMHELATNSTKYGVLNRAEGTLEVAWRLQPRDDGRPHIELAWTERDSPTSPPTHSGFGRQLLETIVPRGLRGDAKLDFDPNGLSWKISFAG